MPRLSRAAPNTSAAHGMAALTVVMVLFFVMAMVAAYTNRSLIFEQRVSANNYRATSAMNASEAGIEWGIAMINGGRVDDNCLGSSNTAHASFRERYLALQSDGSYQTTKWPPVGVQKVFSPSCVLTSAGWNCSCPATGEPTLAYQAPPAPVFRVQFDTSVSPTLASGPGVIILKSRGCSNISNASTASSDPNQVDSCHRASGVTPNVDGLSDLRVALGLARALPVPPPAALTVGRNVSVAGAGALSAVNTDTSTALTVHAGTALPVTGVTPIGPAGSDAAASTNSPDAQLATLAAAAVAPRDLFFQATFGMEPARFSQQPGAVFMDCSAGCTATQVAAQIISHPGRVLWLEGNLVLGDAGPLGTLTTPAMLVVNGDVTISAAVVLNGFLYGRDIVWTAGSAGSLVRGAAVAKRDVLVNGPAAVVYDAAVLKIVSSTQGSFVRVPGSWQTTGIQ